MGAGHTKGPWFCDGRLPGKSDYAIFAQDGVACVAFVKAGCLPASGRGDAIAANARLIAAAPDLLAALRALVPADFDEHPGDFMPEWHQARAAITRATSE